MSSSNDIVQCINKKFQEYINKNLSANCIIPDDWLQQCAQYISEEFPVFLNFNSTLFHFCFYCRFFNTKKNKQLNEYNDLMLEQLLDFDLAEIGVKTLPDKLFSNSKEGSINGFYLLQVNSLLLF
jgi:glutaredoxin 2